MLRLLAGGSLKSAIALAIANSDNPDLIGLSRRAHTATKGYLDGVISVDDLNREVAKISQALQDSL